MAIGIPGFQYATPVTSYGQGVQSGQQQQLNGQAIQQNALTLQNAQQAQSDQSALNNALSQGMSGAPGAQQNALTTLSQTAPQQVAAYNQQVGGITAANAAQYTAKSQAVAQQLGQLVAIPDGPQREAAYQQVLDQEQQQGLDVSQMRQLPANVGIRMAFSKVQSVQDQIKAMQPQSYDLAAGASRFTTDPLTGHTTSQTTPTAGKYVDNFDTGKTDAQGNHILAQGYVTPQGFQPIGRATSQGGQAPQGSNPPGLAGAVQTVESGNNPNAVSSAGAQGLMQLMPQTAANPGFGIQPAQNNSPQENKRVGQQYLQAMMHRYGNLPMALAAYNAGPGTVDAALKQANGDPSQALALLPAETQAYVPKVIAQLPGGSFQGAGVQSQVSPPSQPVAQVSPQAQGGDPGGIGVSVGMGGGAALGSPSAQPAANIAQNIQPVTAVGGQGSLAQPSAESVNQPDALPFGSYVKPSTPTDKIPSGYRLKAGGNGALEPIPGGPADKGASGASLGDPTQTGQAYLASIPDPGLQQQIQAIAEGRMPLPNVSRPSKAGEIGPEQLAAAVAQYDPTYNQQDPQSRIKARNDFTSGKSAVQLRQLNTLLGHLGGVSDAADALNNGSVPMVNGVENALSSGVGRPNVSNFNAAAGPAAEEFAALMKGGSPAVADIEAAKSSLSPNMSPAQLNGTIGTMAAQVQSRIAALQAQANAGLGPYASKVPIITSDGQAALEKLRQKGLIPAFNQGEGANTQPPTGQNQLGLPQPQSEAEYIQLPAGSHYVAPDGSVKIKGGG